MPINLDLSAYKKAIHQLEKSLRYTESPLAKEDSEIALQFRAATIQAFEYTYEMSWRMLKRYLMLTAPNPVLIEALSFADLIRTGNEKSLLLSDLKKWQVFRESRNMTSHAYDDEKAEIVFLIIPAFLKDAQHLLNSLQSKIEKNERI